MPATAITLDDDEFIADKQLSAEFSEDQN